MNRTLTQGFLVAVAAGSLFAAACGKSDDKAKTGASADKAAKVHCMGANACKGQGGCKTASNACKGQNGCKGQGFVDTASADACKEQGGTVMAMQ